MPQHLHVSRILRLLLPSEEVLQEFVLPRNELLLLLQLLLQERQLVCGALVAVRHRWRLLRLLLRRRERCRRRHGLLGDRYGRRRRSRLLLLLGVVAREVTTATATATATARH